MLSAGAALADAGAAVSYAGGRNIGPQRNRADNIRRRRAGGRGRYGRVLGGSWYAGPLARIAHADRAFGAISEQGAFRLYSTSIGKRRCALLWLRRARLGLGPIDATVVV
jgi:hypothetical protein